MSQIWVSQVAENGGEGSAETKTETFQQTNTSGGQADPVCMVSAVSVFHFLLYLHHRRCYASDKTRDSKATWKLYLRPVGSNCSSHSSPAVFFLENFINTLTQLEGSHQRYQQEEERLQYRNCFANKQRWEQVGRAFFLLNPNFLFLVLGLNWTGLCYSPRHQTPWILWVLPTFLLPRQDATQWTPQPSRTFSGEFPSDR